jgi:hypothetical protein
MSDFCPWHKVEKCGMLIGMTEHRNKYRDENEKLRTMIDTILALLCDKCRDECRARGIDPDTVEGREQ